jgi:alpha-beta hydrolase superfamily lysophospholipase
MKESDRYVNFFKSQPRNRKSVLYLHGYNDYFFHTHVEKFNENNFDFYALDLRNTADPSKKSALIIVKTLKNILKKYQLP